MDEITKIRWLSKFRQARIPETEMVVDDFSVSFKYERIVWSLGDIRNTLEMLSFFDCEALNEFLETLEMKERCEYSEKVYVDSQQRIIVCGCIKVDFINEY